jgi:hypothetical protein
MKRAGRVWIRIFPDVPVSKKPAEVRMGKGKGSPEFWVARVKPGRIMFEIDGVTSPDRARGAAAGRGQAADQDAFRRAHRESEIRGESPDEGFRCARHDVDQLDDELLKLKKEQFNLRFQRATGQLENTARVRAGAARYRAHQDRRAPEARAACGKEEEIGRCRNACSRAWWSATSRTRRSWSEVERRFTHPLFKKTVRRSKKYHAHDEANEFKVGDRSGSRNAGRSRNQALGRRGENAAENAVFAMPLRLSAE